MSDIDLIKRYAYKPEFARRLFAWAGGNCALGRRIGVPERGIAARVCNWGARGIPEIVFVRFPALIDVVREFERSDRSMRRHQARQKEAA